MFGLSAISFLLPALLWALLLLPILWWLLRAVPPAPLQAKFPAILLLLGLKDRETTPDRTPWWLLALRILALGLVIVGFAGPVLNPRDAASSSNNLVVLMDASWASANDWAKRQEKLKEILQAADQDGRPAVVFKLSDVTQENVRPNFAAPAVFIERAGGIVPNAWRPDFTRWADYVSAQDIGFDTVWFSDGLEAEGKDALYQALTKKGSVSVIEGTAPVYALTPPTVKDGTMVASVMRSFADGVIGISANGIGPDPNGISQILGTGTAQFGTDDIEIEMSFEMPSDLRNRIKSVNLEGYRSAGSVVVTGDTVQRRKVAIISTDDQQESSDLVSDVFYLRKALVPTAK